MIRMLTLLGLAVSLQERAPEDPLPGTLPLSERGELADLMMRGLHRWVESRIGESAGNRKAYWSRDPASRDNYEKSVAANRDRLRRILGAVDPLAKPRLEKFGDEACPALAAESPRFRAWQVRWDVLEGVTGEGLYLEPLSRPVAHVVALPDADQTPEQLVGLSPGVPAESQFARRLAENGCAVVVPVLISRDFEFSGHPDVAMTNQSHREWIFRQAYQMGRHVIGYEVQKVRAAAEALRALGASRVGVAGYGEGGLVAFYAAAVDPRLDSAFVSGYFGPREECWKEPLYRHVWSLLREFGDAEVATLIAPRGLVVEAAAGPEVPEPARPPAGRRGGAAAGHLAPIAFEAAQGEFERIHGLLPDGFQTRQLIRPSAGFGSAEALRFLASDLGLESRLELAAEAPPERRAGLSPRDRQGRQLRELERHVQTLLGRADRTREAFFLGTTSLLKGLESRGERFRMYRVKTRDPELFARETEKFRTLLWEEGLGRIEDPLPEPRPRSRRMYDRPKWTGYDVVLEAAPEFFAWGVLLVPKDLRPGERRPTVVCQHGRNGLPKDTVEGDTPAYHDFAARLADQGFVVFSPHNPYRGEDLYRMLSRKANLVKASLFSFILHQHRQILAWLKTQPFIDPERIAFYGLSYGGETAVRVPPLLKDYCLSICSGDFNDWARKVASTDNDYSFMYSIEWEMPYFNLGSTFNYAEMAYLMVPRPFMVERGHHDGVAPDPWVASEYAKVRWLYDQLGLGDRTEIEFYNGGHTINGERTFEFLRRHLNWPPR